MNAASSCGWHELKSYLHFGMFTLAATWGMNLGRKRQATLVHREKNKGCREQWNCWRIAGGTFLSTEHQEKSYNPLQKPVESQFVHRHPGCLYTCLFKGCSPVLIPWTHLHSSLFLMAHTNMQTYSGISQILKYSWCPCLLPSLAVPLP